MVKRIAAEVGPTDGKNALGRDCPACPAVGAGFMPLLCLNSGLGVDVPQFEFKADLSGGLGGLAGLGIRIRLVGLRAKIWVMFDIGLAGMTQQT